jgi:hypothetical protein
VNQADAQRLRLTTGFQHRFTPVVQRALKLVTMLIEVPQETVQARLLGEAPVAIDSAYLDFAQEPFVFGFEPLSHRKDILTAAGYSQ